MLQTNLKNYIDRSALQFVTGDLDLNKDWDNYVKGVKALKLDRYLQILQQSYDSSSK